MNCVRFFLYSLGGQFLTSPICPGSLLQHKTAFWTRFRPLICIMFCCMHTFFENIMQNTTLDDHIFCCVDTFFENITQKTTLDHHIFFNTDTFFENITQITTRNITLSAIWLIWAYGRGQELTPQSNITQITSRDWKKWRAQKIKIQPKITLRYHRKNEMSFKKAYS